MTGGAPATSRPRVETPGGSPPLQRQAGRMPGTVSSPNLGTHQFHTMFCIGQRVLIDRDPQLEGTVIGISIHAGGVDYKVAYFHNGCGYEPMIDEFRLEAVQPC